MALAMLLSTSRVAAEATVERLQELGIEAQVLDVPNVFVKLASGGNYRVHVAVPERDLPRARAELKRWDEEAAPRVNALAREVGGPLVLAAVPTLVLGGYLFTRDPVPGWGPAAVVGTLLGSLGAWVAWSRRRGRKP